MFVSFKKMTLQDPKYIHQVPKSSTNGSITCQGSNKSLATRVHCILSMKRSQH